jgi:transposase
MIAAPPGVRVYLACGTTDMRRGMAGLAMQVQQVLSQDLSTAASLPSVASVRA